jgi:hypothetical protein
MNAPKLLSGRVPVTPYSNLPNSRYQFLGLSDAEPSLGVPAATGSLFTSTALGVRSWSNVINIGSNVVTFYEKYTFPNATGVAGQVLASDGIGNLIFTNISGNAELANGTSNVSIPVINGNINMSVNGNANVVVVTDTGANITGTLNVTGNAIISNLIGTLANGNSNVNIPTANGNVNITAGGNTTLVVTSTGANLTGNLSLTGNVTDAYSVSANYLASTSGYVTISQGIIAVVGNNAGIFASLVDDVNIGLEANVIMGAVAGNTTVRGTFNAANMISTGTVTAQNIRVGDLYSNRAPVGVTIDTIVDEFGVNEYRSAKYTIRASNDLGYQALEVLLIHDGINSLITVYGSLSTTGSDIVTLQSVINTGMVQLRATGLATNTVLNLLGTYVPD